MGKSFKTDKWKKFSKTDNKKHKSRSNKHLGYLDDTINTTDKEWQNNRFDPINDTEKYDNY